VTITEVVIGRACDSYERGKECIQNFAGKLKRKYHSDERGVNERIILK
jgi:hypothetical protein